MGSAMHKIPNVNRIALQAIIAVIIIAEGTHLLQDIRQSPPDLFYARIGEPYLKIAGNFCMVVHEENDWESRIESVTESAPDWVTEPAPLNGNHNFCFFTENVDYLGTISRSTIFWTFVATQNSIQRHHQIF